MPFKSYTYEGQALGVHGAEHVDSNDSPASPDKGRYIALQAIGGSADLSATTATTGEDLPSITLPDTGVIVGRFESITVTSGTVRAYLEDAQ